MVDEFIHELFLVFTYAVEWIIMNNRLGSRDPPIAVCFVYDLRARRSRSPRRAFSDLNDAFLSFSRNGFRQWSILFMSCFGVYLCCRVDHENQFQATKSN
jgi:hypothetical protein